MEITISEKYWAHVSKLVDSGRYPSADAVMDRALALLEERDLADTDPAIERELAEIRKKVMEGIKDFEEGRYAEYANVDEIFEDAKRRARERKDRRERRAANDGLIIS